MPELPEVETIRCGLEKSVKNRQIVDVVLRRGGLRAPFPQGFVKTLKNRKILRFRRRAKYILADLEGGYTWLIHLGMSGSFRTIAKKQAYKPEAHDHVIVTLDCGMRLVYNDPRRFGQMDVFPLCDEAAHKSLVHIGPEPLEKTFDGRALAQRLALKKTPIKQALLDQRVVAGIGNIYACEALYRAGISPKKIANHIKNAEAVKLAHAIKAVMREALASGGSTLRDHRQLDGSTGYFQHSFDVYGHGGQPCGDCNCKGKACVRSITQGGRTTFFCPVKQR
ncbi:MAG: bifunctional DNA-formamidopyrimidine glycosylase/DNA-(apurinic or apyrimidinic site) lyase [Proteobacteria bacterium]|nr:bifunctional DNA-formamidopyrimidine glycosylase/DNA-(apurinic or apyrimidinic site) lyase [Pseudomonadota bacterium]